MKYLKKFEGIDNKKDVLFTKQIDIDKFASYHEKIKKLNLTANFFELKPKKSLRPTHEIERIIIYLHIDSDNSILKDFISPPNLYSSNVSNRDNWLATEFYLHWDKFPTDKYKQMDFYNSLTYNYIIEPFDVEQYEAEQAAKKYNI
jgi:hypothetical protein